MKNWQEENIFVFSLLSVCIGGRKCELVGSSCLNHFHGVIS